MFRKTLLISAILVFEAQGTPIDSKSGINTTSYVVDVTCNNVLNIGGFVSNKVEFSLETTVSPHSNGFTITSTNRIRTKNNTEKDQSLLLESNHQESPELVEQNYKRCLKDNIHGKMLFLKADNSEGSTIEFPKKCRQAQVYCALVSAQKEAEIYLEFLKEKYPNASFKIEDLGNRYVVVTDNTKHEWEGSCLKLIIKR